MEYLTIPQIAKKVDRSPHTVQKWATSGRLPGRKVGGTWITTSVELAAFELGHEQIQLAEIYDLKGAAEYLGTSPTITRRLVREGWLKGTVIDKRGRFGGTQAFLKDNLDLTMTRLPELLAVRPGPKVKGEPDKHIEYNEESEKWVVLGTKDKNGNPYAYAFQFDARERARQAFGKPPQYKDGDYVYVLIYPSDKRVYKELEGNCTRKAFVQGDVTPIDKTALVLDLDAFEGTDYEPYPILVRVKEIKNLVSEN